MMKKVISMIMVILLVTSTVVLLAACGGIGGDSDIEKAIENYKTANAVTLKIKDKKVSMNSFFNKETLISESEIAFDAEKGLVSINLEYKRKNFWGISKSYGAINYEMYYVLDGTNVIYYERRISDYSQEWETPIVYEFDTAEKAATFLREKYLKPLDRDNEEYPTFTEVLALECDRSINTFRTKYTWTPSDSRFNYTYTLSFFNGKVTKFTYKHKAAESGNVDDKRTFSMTIKYSADITLPDGLPDADQADQAD